MTPSVLVVTDVQEKLFKSQECVIEVIAGDIAPDRGHREEQNSQESRGLS